MIKRYLKLLTCAVALRVSASSLQAKDLVVDLSAPIVRITTGFSGTELLLFVAKRGAGDVIVVVRGPLEDLVVRRKSRVAGIWVNRAAIAFTDVPSYYAVASTRPSCTTAWTSRPAGSDSSSGRCRAS